MSAPGFQYVFVTDQEGFVYMYSSDCGFIDRFPVFYYGNENATGITPGFMGYDLITTIYVNDIQDNGVYLYNYSLVGQTCLGEWINYIYYRVWDSGSLVYDYDAYCSQPNRRYCVDGYVTPGTLISFSPETWGFAFNDTHYSFFDMLFTCSSDCNLTVEYCRFGCVNGQCLRESDPEAENIDILINQIGQTGEVIKRGAEGIFGMWFPNQNDKMLFGFGMMIILAIGILLYSIKSKVKDYSGIAQGIIVLELILVGVFIAYQFFPWFVGFIYIVPLVWLLSKWASGGIGGK